MYNSSASLDSFSDEEGDSVKRLEGAVPFDDSNWSLWLSITEKEVDSGFLSVPATMAMHSLSPLTHA